MIDESHIADMLLDPAVNFDDASDLFNLLTAIRVVNCEMSKIAQSREQRLGTKAVVNQLLDLALELAMDELAIPPVGKLPF